MENPLGCSHNPWERPGKIQGQRCQACVHTELLHSEIAAEQQNREAALRRPEHRGMGRRGSWGKIKLWSYCGDVMICILLYITITFILLLLFLLLFLLYICIYIYTIYMYIYIYIYIYNIHIYIHICIYMYIYMYIYVYTQYMYKYMYMCVEWCWMLVASIRVKLCTYTPPAWMWTNNFLAARHQGPRKGYIICGYDLGMWNKINHHNYILKVW